MTLCRESPSGFVKYQTFVGLALIVQRALPCTMGLALQEQNFGELLIPVFKLPATWSDTDLSSSAHPVSQQVVWRCQL